jgi:hypothetical protein
MTTFGQLYRNRVVVPQASTNSSIVDVCTSVSCSMADGLPSRLAPRLTFCRVSERCPQPLNIRLRVRVIFTRRPTILAAMALITECGQMKLLHPKPPPMNGETICTFSSGMPSVWATVLRAPTTHWVVSYSVSSSPSQWATDAEGSMGLWCSMGVT